MKKLMCLAVLSALAVASVAVSANLIKNDVTLATINTSYSCASIHFGMKDEDCTAMTYDVSTQLNSLQSKYHAVSNVSIASSSLTNVYCGGDYVNTNTDYTQYALRVGGSKKLGVMSFTLDKEIVGCTVYAIGYNNDLTTLKVNGQEQTIVTFQSQVTKANAEIVEYTPYTFTFDATTNLEITAKQASKTVSGKSVSACRFYIADISLKVL